MNEEFLAFVGGLLIGAVAFGVSIGGCTDSAWRRESVEKGHAEYVLKGNQAVWQWKEPACAGPNK